jgi:hypothetical protein
MSGNISQEEKIDYIYDILQKNERKAKRTLLFKWGFRLFMLWYLYYFITIGLPVMIDNLIPDMSGIMWATEGISPDQIKNAMSEYFSK